jgi:hypothetical protein
LPNQLTLQISGLHLTENQFSSVPPGSLSVAENVIIDYSSVAQSRRGYEKILESAAAIDTLTEFSGVIHAVSNNILYRENAGVLTAYSGDLTPPTGTKNRFEQANEALYFTTDLGVKKIFSVGGNISETGVPRALDGTAGAAVDKTFTTTDVSVGDDTIAFANSFYTTGLKVQVTTAGVLPTGLSTGVDYYLNRFTSGTFKFYTSLSGALAGGATDLVNISGVGSGTSTLVVQDQPFLEGGNKAAYRCVYGYRDSNEYLFRGSPSGRAIVDNTGALSTSTYLTYQIPAGVEEGWFIQIYRSTQGSTSPDDELFLVTEITLDSSMIAASEISYNDKLIDALLGEALYTNATQQGILNSNDEPPFATDITNYKGFMIYGNTRLKETLYSQMVVVPAVDSTVTIGSEVYTAKTVENSVSKHFQVFTSGTESENIQNTAISLVKMINKGSSSYNASYLSSGEPAGYFLIQGNTLSIANFNFNSTAPDSFSPTPPTAGLFSNSEARKNRVYVSKQQQPDAVPVSRFLEIGDPKKAILRVIALRDSIFVIKEDGLFRIVGDSYETMRISVFDRTAIILGAETAVVLSNSIYLHTNQGVLAVADNGSVSIGDPIDFPLQVASKNNNFSSLAFGLADQTFGRYILYYPELAGDTQCTKAFVFNTTTNTWVSWTIPASCGYVGSQIYLAGQDAFSDFWIQKERVSFTLDDYVDHSFDGQITDIDLTNNILTLRAEDIAQTEEGAQIIQGGAKANVLSVLSSTTVSVEITKGTFYKNAEFTDAEIDPVLFTISLPGHQYQSGDSFQLATTDTLPTPLAIDTTYYVIAVDEDTIQLAVDPADVIDGIPISISNDGVGTHTALSGGCDVAKPIAVRLIWNPTDGGDPSKLKHFQMCNFIFGNSTFSTFVASFQSSFSPLDEFVDISAPEGSSEWGQFPWGSVPWGDTLTAPQIIRTYIPLEKRRGVWILVGYSVAQAYSDVQARGMTIGMQETGDFFR